MERHPQKTAIHWLSIRFVRNTQNQCCIDSDIQCHNWQQDSLQCCTINIQENPLNPWIKVNSFSVDYSRAICMRPFMGLTWQSMLTQHYHTTRYKHLKARLYHPGTLLCIVLLRAYDCGKEEVLRNSYYNDYIILWCEEIISEHGQNGFIKHAYNNLMHVHLD